MRGDLNTLTVDNKSSSSKKISRILNFGGQLASLLFPREHFLIPCSEIHQQHKSRVGKFSLTIERIRGFQRTPHLPPPPARPSSPPPFFPTQEFSNFEILPIDQSPKKNTDDVIMKTYQIRFPKFLENVFVLSGWFPALGSKFRFITISIVI